MYREGKEEVRQDIRKRMELGEPRMQATQDVFQNQFYMVRFADNADNHSATLRLATFREFAEIFPIAHSAHSEGSRTLELYGKSHLPLTHILAHELAHLFDPVKDETKTDSPFAVPFKSNRAELFAELFAHMFLCQASGSDIRDLTALSYGGETVELTPEAQSAIAQVYKAASGINPVSTRQAPSLPPGRPARKNGHHVVQCPAARQTHTRTPRGNARFQPSCA
jgi:hypothetical protein